MISDWCFDYEMLKMKGGGIGSLQKGERCLAKSHGLNSMSLYIGYKEGDVFYGSFIVRGLAKYAAVYNQDTPINKHSSVLYMKVENGIPDDDYHQYGPRLCQTVGRCSNILGQRYVFVYIL